MTSRVRTIDCEYTERPGIAAAYLIQDGSEAAFVETNTANAVPLLLAELERAGLAPEQVRYVIITHIHLDHAGGAGPLMRLCPNATLLAHPKAARHAIDPSRIEAGARAVYGEHFDRLYGELLPIPAERVRALEDGAIVPFGQRELHFHHTRGHANHHFVVHDPGADAVFTGDSFGLLYPHLQHRGPFAFPSTTPTDFDAEAAIASVERIRALGAGRVFPTHFGEHRSIDVIAEQLVPGLRALGAIVDEADADEEPDASLDRRCLDAAWQVMDAALADHGLTTAADREAVKFDVQLNAQGLAFAVRKRRFKRSRSGR